MSKVYSGRDGALLYGGTSLAKVSSVSLTADLNLLETTTLGDNLRSYTPGIQGFTGSATLLYYKDDDGDIDASQILKKLYKTGTEGVSESDKVTLTFRLIDGTADNNDVELTAYITGVGFGVSTADTVKANISFTATGSLTTASI
tara:strand:+ start:191 stop:625 length:435 start_codon:yes stop_codon:yes gene_type:complete